jgi:hypothetical protein
MRLCSLILLALALGSAPEPAAARALLAGKAAPAKAEPAPLVAVAAPPPPLSEAAREEVAIQAAVKQQQTFDAAAALSDRNAAATGALFVGGAWEGQPLGLNMQPLSRSGPHPPNPACSKAAFCPPPPPADSVVQCWWVALQCTA